MSSYGAVQVHQRFPLPVDMDWLVWLLLSKLGIDKQPPPLNWSYNVSQVSI